MAKLWTLITAIFLSSCASDELLKMNVYHLREENWGSNRIKSLPDAERRFHLRGAVTAAEREQRKGLYYTARWNAKEEGRYTLKFSYLQARTASRVLTLTETDLPKTGAHNFVINGENYQKNGRVLAWKLELFQGNRLIATEQSYLWD